MSGSDDQAEFEEFKRWKAAQQANARPPATLTPADFHRPEPPKPGMSRFARGCLMAVAVVIGTPVVIGIMLAIGTSSRGAHTPSAEGTDGATSAPAPALPETERRFIEALTAAQGESANAENDMQRGAVKARRDAAVCSIMKSRQVTDWVGTVKDVSSNTDGKGVLAVYIAHDVTVETQNNAISDNLGAMHTLIPVGSPLFNTASHLHEGQTVHFSGTFLPSDESGCLEESSLTLNGTLSEPDFIFRFSAIAAD